MFERLKYDGTLRAQILTIIYSANGEVGAKFKYFPNRLDVSIDHFQCICITNKSYLAKLKHIIICVYSSGRQLPVADATQNTLAYTRSIGRHIRN